MSVNRSVPVTLLQNSIKAKTMTKFNAVKFNTCIILTTVTIILFNSGHKVDATIPTFLTNLAGHVADILNLKSPLPLIRKSSTMTCYSCKLGTAMLQYQLKSGKSSKELANFGSTICMSLKLSSPRICKAFLNVNRDNIATVLSQLALSPSDICGLVLGESCAQIPSPLYNWTVPLTPRLNIGQIDGNSSKNDPKVVRVLHLSDTHVDTQYATGGDALCGELQCCRPAQRNVPLGERAGYWGDYRDCDVPLRTLDGMLKHISSFHRDIDYVMWTGDVAAHDTWNQTRNGQLKIIRTVASLLNRYLGHIPIFPALGNHESAPANSFPTPDIKGNNSISWLYDELEDIWSHWLPDHTHGSIKKGAYYSTHVKQGLKLISLNMNYCNIQNIWLLLNTTDPADELVWLANELDTSELLGEKVHIIGHIPPGSNDCFQIWSRNYYEIVNRYQNTIVGQFFGHLHQDEFELFYEQIPSNSSLSFDALRPTNMAYIGPAATTHTGVNPGYRIYVVDAETFQVCDHETYFVNLTRANLVGDSKPLTFELGYAAKLAYGLDSLSPSSWHDLVVAMVKDDKVFQQFYKYLYNNSGYDQLKPCTDLICKSDILCQLVNAKSQDSTICQKFLKDLMP